MPMPVRSTPSCGAPSSSANKRERDGQVESTLGRYNGRQRGGYVQGRETSMAAVHPAALDAEASDEELMRLVAAGHQDALGPLYSRYAPFIFNLAAQSLDRPG